MWTYRARITRILDGDTVEALLDLGFGVAITVMLRLEGVYAVEHTNPAQASIVSAVSAWLATHEDASPWPVLVRTARIKSDAHEVTTLGRYVATITATSGSPSLNADMTTWLGQRGLTGGYGAPKV